MRVGGALARVRASSAATLRRLLDGATLYEAAARMPGARAIEGRGAAFAVSTTDGEWLVRHYRRGGAFAPLLGDRYARAFNPRAFHELGVSSAARAVNIPTPEVIAAVSYPSGVFVRSDIAVAFVPNSFDLAAALFDSVAEDVDAEISKAAALIRTVCERGLVHSDLNLKNILLAPEQAYVIDLDRCRMSEPSRAAAAAMRSRFVRSLEKWQKQKNQIVAPARRRTLEEAFNVG